MKEYIYKGPICHTIYRRYNKQYCTPPIYEAYRCDLLLLLFGIVSSVIFAFFPNEYYYVFWIEAAFGASYLINAIVIRNAFTGGLLDTSISDRSKMFIITRAFAYVSQVCLYHITIPMILVICGNENFVSDYTPLTIGCSAAIVLINVILPFGIGCKKYYNKNAQTAYSYIIEGPGRASETIDTLYKSLTLEPMRALNHYDMATYKYFQARDLVSKENIELRKMIDNYDEAWRRSIIYSQYMYSKKIPETTSYASAFIDKILKVNDEVKKFNVIVDVINAKEYIPKTKTSTKARTTITAPIKDQKPRVSDETPPAQVVVDVIWDHRVNWY